MTWPIIGWSLVALVVLYGLVWFVLTIRAMTTDRDPDDDDFPSGRLNSRFGGD